MSLNDKAILPEDQSLDPSYALRPSMPLVDNGNGEWASNNMLPAAEPAAGPQIFTYLHALRRHWLLATALGLVLASASGLAVWLSNGARYTAEAYLKCSMRSDEVIKQRGYVQPVSEMEFEVFKNTQLSIMTNRLVLNAALRLEPKVGEETVIVAKLPELVAENDPVDWLIRKLSISFPRKDEILRVSITTKDPVHSAAIVKAVTEAYLNEVVDTNRTRLDEQINKLKSIQISKAMEVKDSLSELRRMADALGTSDTDMLNQKQKSLLEELATVRQQYLNNFFKMNQMESELEAKQAELEVVSSQPPTDIEVQQLNSWDPILRDLQEKLAEMEQAREMFAGVVKSDSKSKYANNIMGQYAKLQEKLRNRLDELKKDLAAKKQMEVERDVKKLEAAVASVKKQLDTTQEDLKELRKKCDSFGTSTIDMQMKRAANNTALKALDDINIELNNLRVEERNAPRITKIQDAELPKIESGFFMRVALAGMASVVGFCLPFVGVVVWDLQSNHINGADDVTNQLGLPVIGSVPRIPSRVLHHQGTPKKGHQMWQLRLTESVDSISARLLRQAETEQRRVVMVTSAINGEGKTTLSAQLAMSLARAGRRTLLVDFDLRQPTFDEVFGVPRAPGISEILRGECDLANCIHATGADNLSVLTAGCWDRFALAALANNCVGSMFKELREDYEFVIVDTSPILPIADTRLVSQYVDSVVLCVFRDVSQAPLLRSACEILEAFGVRSVEAVVTGVTERLGGKNFGYYQRAQIAAS